MKKTLLILFILFIGGFVSSCEKKDPDQLPDPDDETPIVDPIPYTYTLDEANFEFFIHVTNEVTHNGIAYEAKTTFSLNEAYVYESIEVSYFVYISYLLPEARSLYSVSRTETLTPETLEFVDVLPFNDATEVELFYFMVVYATGTITHAEELTVVNTTYTFPEFINDVIPEDTEVSIDIEDTETNQRIHDALVDLIQAFENKEASSFVRTQSSLYTYNGTYQTATEASFMAMQAQDDPFYLELFDGESTTIVLNHAGTLFSYTYGPHNLVNGKYQIDPVVIGNISDLGIDEDESINELRFDPLSMRFEEVSQGFLVTGMIDEIFSSEDYLMISGMYLDLGVSVENLRNTVVEALYIMVDDIYTLTISLSIQANIGYLETIDILTVSIVSLESVEMTDLNDDVFVILAPNSTEKVRETTDVTVLVESQQRPMPHFYRVELQKGQYLLHDRDNSVLFEIFHEDGTPVVSAKPLENIAFSRYLFIEEANTYYLRIQTRTSQAYSGYGFYLEALDYETVFDRYVPTPLDLGDQTFELEGPHDFMHLSFDALEPSLIAFTITSSEGFVNLFYYEARVQGIRSVQFPFYTTSAISVQQGLSSFYIQAQFATSVTVSLEIYDTSHHRSDVLEDMMQITDTFEGEPYFSSSVLGPTYFKMEVQEKSYVVFYIDRIGAASTTSMYIYTPSMTLVNNNPIMSSGYGITLEAGVYILKGTSDHLSAGRVRFESVPYANQTFQFDIESYPSMMPYNDDFPFVMSLHYDYHHEVSHVFTLTETSQVLIRSSNYHLKDSDGFLLSFKFDQYTQPSVQVYLLEPGTYTLTKFNKEVHASRTFKINIAIIAVMIADDAPLGNTLAEITHGHYSFNQDYNNDVEAVKLVLTQTTTLLNSSLRAFLFDSDKQLMQSFSGYLHVQLTPGTYYLVAYDYSYNKTTWNISVNPY